MILKRRDKASMAERARAFFAPRKGFWRGFGYLGKRMRRLPDSPHRIALGFACGALASFTPFFTLHFIVAAILAWMVRANMFAALIGTVVGNPITFPLISSTSIWLGRWMLGREGEDSDFEAVMKAFGEAATSLWTTIKGWFGYQPSTLDGFILFLDEVFWPYLVGGIVPGLICAIISYWIVGPIVAAYQERRRRSIAAKAEKRRAEAEAEYEAYVPDNSKEGDRV